MRSFKSLLITILLFIPLYSIAKEVDEPGMEFFSLDEPRPATNTSNNPSKLELLGVATLMAVPEYFLQILLHEGSHMVALKSFGGRVIKFNIFPEFYESGVRFSGYTYESDKKLNKPRHAIMHIAPKITDLLIMGTYAGLINTGCLPKNKYTQLAILMIASGATIDFGKDIFSTAERTDVVKTYKLLGADSFEEQLPFRIMQGAVTIVMVTQIIKGIKILLNDKTSINKNEKKFLPYTNNETIGLTIKF